MVSVWPSRTPPSSGGSPCAGGWLFMLGSAFIDTRRNPEDRGLRLFFNFNGMDMQTPWQRKRQPDDVPTPVAVALSDYCRRAKSPAPAPEVRAALALIAE